MNLKKLHITLFLFISVLTVESQNAIKTDTSYTVYSSYKKYVKYFPQIENVKLKAFKNIVENKGIVYKEIGNRKLHIGAFYDKNIEIKLAVILVHGGGWKPGNKSLMKPLAVEIASKGYACFTVEYRLSPEAKYPAAIFDVKSAIQFVKINAAKFNIDTTSVAVLGCSSGGQMAALIGATNGDKNFEERNTDYKSSANVQAVIDIDGILAFKHPQSEEDVVASLWLNGSYETNPENWISASALTHTNKNTPPILFIGSQYPRFLAGRDDMIKILNLYGIYSQVEMFPESPHSFWLFHPWFEDTVNYIINFLDRTLKEN